MPEIKANLTNDQYQALLNLAQQRGVDAETVLQQAIETEQLISQNVGAKDELLIKKSDNTMSKIVFGS